MNRKNFAYFFNKVDIFLLYAIVISFFSTFIFISNKSYWFDETFGILTVKDWHKMLLVFYRDEGNMWFYYFILYFWIKLGDSELIVRTLSALFGLASIPFVYVLSKNFFTKFEARLTTFLVACNFFFIFYAQQARGYSLLFLLLCINAYLLFKITKNNKIIYLIFYILSSVLVIYTHLYGALVIFAEQFSLIFLSTRKKLYPILFIPNIIIFLLLLPLFLSPSFHGSQINWLPKPKITNILGIFVLLSGDFLPLVITFIPLFLYGLFIVYKCKKQVLKNFHKYWEYIFLVSWLVIPIIISFLISVFFKPIYQSVYFIICLFPFLLLISRIIHFIKYKKVKILLIFLIFFFSFVRLYGWYTQNNLLKSVISNNTEDWKGATSYVIDNSIAGDSVIFYPYIAKQPFYFYLNKNISLKKKNITIQELSNKKYALGGGDKTSVPDKNILLMLKYKNKRIWLVENNLSAYVLDMDRQRNYLHLFFDQSFLHKQIIKFPYINVSLYN